MQSPHLLSQKKFKKLNMLEKKDLFIKIKSSLSLIKTLAINFKGWIFY